MESVQTIAYFVQSFEGIFTRPSFENFRYLLLSWIMAPNRHTITNLLRCRALVPEGARLDKHFSVFHRFFTRARWNPCLLGQVAVQLLSGSLGPEVLVLVDDTLCRRSGPKILGAGMHHDARSSTYSGREGSKVRLSFGISFVVVSLWVPLSFCHSGGLAVPVLFGLYRSPKSCPKEQYRKRTEMAADLLLTLKQWLPNKKLTVTGDREYMCRIILKKLKNQVRVIGPMPGNARLYSPEIKPSTMGRPRVWGERQASPKDMATQGSWSEITVHIYGKLIQLLVKQDVLVWASGGPDQLLKIVITRDPSGRYRDLYLFATDPTLSATDVIETFARRWSIEVMLRNSKQLLGLEEIANGWTRAREKPKVKKSGPQADNARQPLATQRTAPFAWIAYTFVVVWYLSDGQPSSDIARARQQAAWYLQKETICFQDMLNAFRRAHLQELFAKHDEMQPSGKLQLENIVEALLAA